MTSEQSIQLDSSNSSNLVDINQISDHNSISNNNNLNSYNNNNNSSSSNNSNNNNDIENKYIKQVAEEEGEEESYVTCKVEQLNINENLEQSQVDQQSPIQSDINSIIQDQFNNSNSNSNNNGIDISFNNNNNNDSSNNNYNNSNEQQQQQDNSYFNNNINFLEVLKPELINYIFLQVGAFDMPSLIGVNRQCYKIGMNEKLWLYFVEKDFNVDFHEIHQLIRLNGGVRSLYANLYFKRKNSIIKPSSPNPLVKYFLKPISKLPNLFSRKEYKTLMYGLDGVGKTSMLYKFARGENVRTLHTNGYNVEVVEYKSCDFICWDIGFEQNSIVPVWHHYLQDTQAIIFIIDATDRVRIRQVREEFWKLVTDKNVEKIVNNFKPPNQDHCKVKVLIYLNKLDQTALSPMSTLEITQALSLFNLPNNILWHVQGCSAISEEGDGLYEGLDYLSSVLE